MFPLFTKSAAHIHLDILQKRKKMKEKRQVGSRSGDLGWSQRTFRRLSKRFVASRTGERESRRPGEVLNDVNTESDTTALPVETTNKQKKNKPSSARHRHRLSPSSEPEFNLNSSSSLHSPAPPGGAVEASGSGPVGSLE